MKILRNLLIVVLVLLVLAGVGLQMFLSKGLTEFVAGQILPKVEAEYGVEVSVENVSVNLLAAKAVAKGVRVGNPAGFTTPHLLTADSCSVTLELMSLLKRDPLVVNSIKLEGLDLQVERNKAGQINLTELTGQKIQLRIPESLSEALSADRPIGTAHPDEFKEPVAVTTEPAEAAAKPTAQEMIPVHIRRLLVDGQITYTDPIDALNLPMKLRLTASDLYSIPAENQPDSLVVLRGSHAEKSDTFVTDLQAFVKPLSNPTAPSFTLSGTLNGIDASLVQKVLGAERMTSGPVSVNPSVTSKNGQLAGSIVQLVIQDLVIRNIAFGDTTLDVPLIGTIQNPQPDYTKALRDLYVNQPKQILKGVAQKLLEVPQLQEGTNLTGQASSNEVENVPTEPKDLGDVLVEQLEDNVKELQGNEELKNTIKNLSNTLFGD
jgi:hypothetical protein